MKKWSEWIRTWTVPQALVVGFGMLCVTAMSITITLHDDWGRLVRWLAHPESMALVGGIVLWAIGLYHRALKTPVTMLLVVCLGGSLLSGCGASALVMQGRAATIVGVGLGSIGQEVHDQRARALDACDADAVPTQCEAEQASVWAPAVAAYESARAALSTWIEALSVAREAGADDGDVLSALFVAVARLARQWNALAAALRGVGVEVPDLPPSLAALLAAASGATS